MSSSKPRPIVKSQWKSTLLTAGFVVFLLLLLLGAWTLLNLKPPSSPEALVTSIGVAPMIESPEAQAVTSNSELPEAEDAPEADAPGTPSPGFTDDFSKGLGPDWTVHFGDAIVQEGRLTSHVGAGLAAGDRTWKNYRIEFDVDTRQNDCSFVDSSNSVGVRVQDFDHAYWFVFNNCEAAWSLFAGGVQDGALNLLPDTTFKISSAQKHITIKVEENKMSSYENGTVISSMIDPQWKSGGIFLQVEALTYYDNFQVTLLP